MDTSSFSPNPAPLAAAPDTSIGNTPPGQAYPEAQRDQAGEAELGNPPHASDPLDPAGTPSPADPTMQPGLGEDEDELDDVPDPLEDPELSGRAQPTQPQSGRDESLEPGRDPGMEDNPPDLSDDLADPDGLSPTPRENAARLTALSSRQWALCSSLGTGLLTLMFASAVLLAGSLALWARPQRAIVETTDYVNS
jgi:hypothetical protein